MIGIGVRNGWIFKNSKETDRLRVMIGIGIRNGWIFKNSKETDRLRVTRDTDTPLDQSVGHSNTNLGYRNHHLNL
ncbi:hypothetical protein Hdeb2414_s0085g00783211 [Helianthus debilis subsp. tardiflorus]